MEKDMGFDENISDDGICFISHIYIDFSAQVLVQDENGER